MPKGVEGRYLRRRMVGTVGSVFLVVWVIGVVVGILGLMLSVERVVLRGVAPFSPDDWTEGSSPMKMGWLMELLVVLRFSLAVVVISMMVRGGDGGGCLESSRTR